MAAVVDLVRLFAGVSVLAFASYTDWRWRRAPNFLWTILASFGAVLLVIDLVVDRPPWSQTWPYLVAIPVFAALIYVLWWFGLIAGGADAKGLMAIGVLAPFPIDMGGLPLWPTPLPASLSVLTNSLLAFMAVPLGILLWNIAHGDWRVPHLFLGVRRRAGDIRRGHVWPMETLAEDGTRRTRFFASRMTDAEIEATFARIQALRDARIWVSPKVPFMIPMAVGFVAAFALGDVLVAALAAFLP